MMFKLQAVMLCLLFGVGATGEAVEDPQYRDLSHLVPVLAEIYPDLYSFDVCQSVHLGEKYYAVVIGTRIRVEQEKIPKGESPCLAHEQRSVTILILDATTNAYYMSLGTFPAESTWGARVYAKDSLIAHADEHHLVYNEPPQMYGFFRTYAVYFDLDKQEIIQRIEREILTEAPFHCRFIVALDDRVLATNWGLSPVITLPGGVFPKGLESIAIHVFPKAGEQRMGASHVYFDGIIPVFAGREAEYRFEGEDNWTVTPRVERLPQPGKNDESLSTFVLRDDVQRLPGGDRVVSNTGVPGTRILVQEDEITVVSDADVRHHVLPQPGVFDYIKMRNQDYNVWVYSKSKTSIKNELGPFHYDNGRLLFGLSFYNGEGVSGIGGLGCFDLSTGELTIDYHAPMRDYSVSAMYVDDDGSIWLGMINRPEGEDSGQGLLHYQPELQVFTYYPVSDLIEVILRSGDCVYIGTPAGLMVLRDERTALVQIHDAPCGAHVVEVTHGVLRSQEVTKSIALQGRRVVQFLQRRS